MPLLWRQLTSLLGPPGSTPPQTIWLPTPQTNDKRIVLRAPQALTISRIDAVVSGGSSPSASFSLRHGTDVSAAGTSVTSSAMTVSSTSTGATFSSFASPAVPAEHWLWLEISAASGSPDGLTVVVTFS
jgi:hypothetical protein